MSIVLGMANGHGQSSRGNGGTEAVQAAATAGSLPAQMCQLDLLSVVVAPLLLPCHIPNWPGAGASHCAMSISEC